MIDWFQAKEFLKYQLQSTGIHSAHSPFLFDFIQNVLHDKRTFYCYEKVERLREKLLLSEEGILVNDLGAGSKVSQSPKRTIRSIAIDAATPAKFAQLLFRIGTHYGCKSVLELGTSFGLTTLYLSCVSEDARVITIEGDESVAAYAAKHFQSLQKSRINLIQGAFENELPSALKQLGKVDLAYIDGNHRRDSTLNYFRQILPFTHEKSILVFGDIHWSKEMKRAWKEITSSQLITATVDLFYVGIIFFRKELSKQDFVIRW
jgi:predicted O-methyltransferase YrrM